MHISKWLYISCFVLCRESVCKDILKSRKYGERIVGGNVTEIDFHPYQVDLQEGCGGSIIGRRWILTAAHCNSANLKTVYVGSSIKGKGTPYKIRSAIQMPLHFIIKDGIPYYDFMLLELNKPLVYGPTVRPIKIGREEDIVVGEYGNVTEYGSIGNATASQILRGVALPIIDYNKCQHLLREKAAIMPNVICAGYVGGEARVCHQYFDNYMTGEAFDMGDSGGPLVIGGKLLGVTSFIIGTRTDCGFHGYPGVFGSVPIVRSWIRRVTGIE